MYFFLFLLTLGTLGLSGWTLPLWLHELCCERPSSAADNGFAVAARSAGTFGFDHPAPRQRKSTGGGSRAGDRLPGTLTGFSPFVPVILTTLLMSFFGFTF